MRHRKLGQIGIEYLIIASFVAFLVIGILGFAFYYVNEVRDTIKFNEIQGFAEKIISSAESTYYSGEPSRVTMQAYLPSGVTNISVIGKELVFDVTTSSGMSRIAFTSNVPIESQNSSISAGEGLRNIQITAQSDKVILAFN